METRAYLAHAEWKLITRRLALTHTLSLSFFLSQIAGSPSLLITSFLLNPLAVQSELPCYARSPAVSNKPDRLNHLRVKLGH